MTEMIATRMTADEFLAQAESNLIRELIDKEIAVKTLLAG